MAPTHVDGKIFWVVEPNLGPISLDCEIVSFDVKKEEFEVIQGPPCISNGSVPMSILELRGALCMSCSDNSKNVIDIWMMKEVATWSVEYHIELEEFSPEYSSERTTPLAIDPNNGRILLSTGWSLGYYDPKTETMETIYSVGMRHDDLRFCPIICHESFVSTI
jgi:F-box interacting protein